MRTTAKLGVFTLSLLGCLVIFTHSVVANFNGDRSSSTVPTFLGESRVAEIFQCVKELLKAKNLLEDISAALKLHLYPKAISDIEIMASHLEHSIEKCAQGTCWMEGQQRCENETEGECEKWGLIWYPLCRDGYHNNACCVCSQDCPSGFRDDGLECGKPSSYGRGAGYPWDFGDPMNLNKAMQRCLKANPTLGCEKNGEIIYPKCRQNFHNVGCCVCSPNCPSSMTDIGVSCQKKTYGRGVGFEEGKCIYEDWNDLTPADVFSKCIDMAEQLAIDIDVLLESIEDKDRKIHTIKRAYTLLQHANTFLYHCANEFDTSSS